MAVCGVLLTTYFPKDQAPARRRWGFFRTPSIQRLLCDCHFGRYGSEHVVSRQRTRSLEDCEEGAIVQV